MKASADSNSHSAEDCVLVLQGGGALGAYQAGVFESLSEVYREPTWVAGISIGAINAAIITGNAAGSRVARLRDFWELVSSSLAPPLVLWCVAKAAPSYPAFVGADAFAIHFLDAGHQELALRFAGRSER